MLDFSVLIDKMSPFSCSNEPSNICHKNPIERKQRSARARARPSGGAPLRRRRRWVSFEIISAESGVDWVARRSDPFRLALWIPSRPRRGGGGLWSSSFGEGVVCR